MRWKLAIAFAMVFGGLAACNEPAATVETACSNLCNCSEDPFQEHQCNRQCAPLLDSFAVPQPCLDCIADVTCTELEQGGCDAVCNALAEGDLP